MTKPALTFDDDDLMGLRPLLSIEEEFCQLLAATNVGWTAYRDTIAAYRNLSNNKMTLRKNASELMAKPHIKARVDQIRRETYEANEVTPERVIHELSKIAFFDIRNTLDSNGNMLPVHLMDDNTAGAIAGIELERKDTTVRHDIYRDSDDEVDIGAVKETVVATSIAKIKLADKRAALGDLSKILGMSVDKHEITGAGGQPLIPENDIETARRVAFLLSQGLEAQTNG